MHRLARADFPNRKQIVHEILHPEDRSAPQSSYSHYSGINYSALARRCISASRTLNCPDRIFSCIPGTICSIISTPEQKKFLIGKQYSVEHWKPGGNGNNQHTAAAKKSLPPEEIVPFLIPFL